MCTNKSLGFAIDPVVLPIGLALVCALASSFALDAFALGDLATW